MIFAASVIAISSIALLTYITTNLSAMIAHNHTKNFRDRIKAPTTDPQPASQESAVIREPRNMERMMHEMEHQRCEHKQQMTAIRGSLSTR